MNVPTPTSRPPCVAVYCIDQDPATTSSLGIYHYTRNLIRALAEGPTPGFEVRLLLSACNAADLAPRRLPPWMTVRLVAGHFATGPRRVLADHVLAPWLAWRETVSVLHYPKGYVPAWCPPGVRVVATLHDTISCHYAAHPPAGMSRGKLRYFDWMTRHTLRRADRVLTDSRYSRAELGALVPGTARKIDVIYVGPGVLPSSGVSEQPRSGVLVLGSRFPHKATAETLRLLTAYAARRSWPEPVTVTGLSAWPDEWGPAPANAAIRFVGRVAEAELARLMRSTRALVLLSTLEGFGLPALESYAAHTPVCYRATTSLGEILEGLPGGWDGADPDGFFRAFDEALAIPAEEVARIADRLDARFNWRKAARDVVRVYREALNLPAGGPEAAPTPQRTGA